MDHLDGIIEVTPDEQAQDTALALQCEEAQESDAAVEPVTPTFHYLSCPFPQQPQLLYHSSKEYSDGASRYCPNSNFLKGVKWSPDGACLLTASDDNCLRVFDLPADAHTSTSAAPAVHRSQDTIKVGLHAVEGETIYDYAWYSRMTTTDAVSCCFASTTRGNPIHLWDACAGTLRCTYRGYDDADEVTAAYSLAFQPDGTKLYGGYKKSLRVFDVSRPGRDCVRVNTHIKREASLPGIISCIAFNTGHQSFACGSYSGLVALFDTQRYKMQLLLQGHVGGVTHVLFSQDGNFLFSGARQDPYIWCWDVRYTRDAVSCMQRSTSATNQRIYFDVEPGSRYLATGGTDGAVKVFDLQSAEEVQQLVVSSSTVNGCAFSPTSPFLATATGQRQYPLAVMDDDSSGDDAGGVTKATRAEDQTDNTLGIWRLEHAWLNWASTDDQDVVEEGDKLGAADEQETELMDQLQVTNEHRTEQMDKLQVANEHRTEQMDKLQVANEHGTEQMDKLEVADEQEAELIDKLQVANKHGTEQMDKLEAVDEQ